MEDLANLPFTEPTNLAEDTYDFLCVSLGEIARGYLFDTSGTTGLPKQVFCTKQDIERMVDFMSAGMSTVANSGDTVLIPAI